MPLRLKACSHCKGDLLALKGGWSCLQCGREAPGEEPDDDGSNRGGIPAMQLYNAGGKGGRKHSRPILGEYYDRSDYKPYY